MSAPALYHGTRVPFGRGGLLLPAADTGSERRPGSRDDGAWVYMTPDPEHAEWYALNTPTRGRTLPRVLTVRPLSIPEPDPSTYDGEHGMQWRCRDGASVLAVRIVR